MPINRILDHILHESTTLPTLCDSTTPPSDTMLTPSEKWSDTLGNQGQKASVLNTLAFQDVNFFTKLALNKNMD